MADTYPAPEHGWTCFHCGETFLDQKEARDHFGHHPAFKPACLIDAATLRRLRFTERDIREAQIQIGYAKGCLMAKVPVDEGMIEKILTSLKLAQGKLADART